MRTLLSQWRRETSIRFTTAGDDNSQYGSSPNLTGRIHTVLSANSSQPLTVDMLYSNQDVGVMKDQHYSRISRLSFGKVVVPLPTTEKSLPDFALVFIESRAESQGVGTAEYLHFYTSSESNLVSFASGSIGTGSRASMMVPTTIWKRFTISGSLSAGRAFRSITV